MHELNAHADAGSLQWNVACAFRDAPNAKLLLHFGRFEAEGVVRRSHLLLGGNCASAAPFDTSGKQSRADRLTFT